MVVEGRVTPLDPEVQLPMLIRPDPDLPKPIYPGTPNHDRIADWHHPEHPGIDLEATLDGKSLRNSVAQWVLYKDHHLETGGYHGHLDGPYTEDRKGRFGRTLLHIAECIPRHALSFRNGRAEVVLLDRFERRQMRIRGDIRIPSIASTKTFWLEYVLDQLDDEPSLVNQDTIDQFREAETQLERVIGASTIVRQLAEVAVDPFRKRFETAIKKGVLKQGTTNLPGKFVCGTILRGRANIVVNQVQLKVAQLRKVSEEYDETQVLAEAS